MRNMRIAAMVLAIAVLGALFPLKAGSAWALPSAYSPAMNELQKSMGTSDLKTDVAQRRYYPRYRGGSAGYRNYAYRGNRYYGGAGYRNYAYRGNRYYGGSRYYGPRYYAGRYNWRTHGPRYRYRYRGYNHYYGGYWYAFPWWTAGYGYYNNYYDDGYAGGGYDDHVQWCLNRYRSYNPRTDTFMGYDGRRHRCNSPYN
jgi:hypothetical protein